MVILEQKTNMLLKNTATLAVKKLKEEYAHDTKYCKVRDHCYNIGKYRVAYIAYEI